MRPVIIPAVAEAFLAGTAGANEFEPAIQAYFDPELSAPSSAPVVVSAISAQNGKTASCAQAQIDELDRIWRAEVVMAGSAMIRSDPDNPAAGCPSAKLEEAGGAIAGIFVMDARGLNVAASSVTSDYWQGDEEKFTESFPKGAGALHISEIEFDESSQTFQSRVSFTVFDPAAQEPLGAVTVGFNADAPN